MLLCEGVVREEEWRKQVLEGWIHRYQWLFRLLLFCEYRGVRTSKESGYFMDKEGYGGVFEKLCLRSLLNIREYVWIVC